MELGMFDPTTRAIQLLGTFSQPTAPYHEHLVVRAIIEQTQEVCRRERIALFRDVVGNLLLTSAPEQPCSKTLILAAHLDHPGFVVSSYDDRSAVLHVLGGVPRQYCLNMKVLLVDLQGQTVNATILEELEEAQYRAYYESAPPDFQPLFATYDLPLFKLEDRIIWGVAMDDLAGCALALAAFERIVAKELPLNCWAVFHRSEEVGFLGATALATSGIVDSRALFISLEASKALPGAEVNRGPVIRSGDKEFLFDGDAEGLLETAGKIVARDGVRVQRRVMEGGTCESSLYQAAGYTAAAIAVPLLNYHNNTGERLDLEGIGIYDLNAGVSLLEETALLITESTKESRADFLARNLQRFQLNLESLHRYRDRLWHSLPIIRS